MCCKQEELLETVELFLRQLKTEEFSRLVFFRFVCFKGVSFHL